MLATLALNSDTPLLIPLGLVCTLITILIGTTWRLANFVRDLREQLKDMQKDLRASWTFRDMEKWALRLERENRSKGNPVWVPDVKRADDDEKAAEPV